LSNFVIYVWLLYFLKPGVQRQARAGDKMTMIMDEASHLFLEDEE